MYLKRHACHVHLIVSGMINWPFQVYLIVYGEQFRQVSRPFLRTCHVYLILYGRLNKQINWHFPAHSARNYSPLVTQFLINALVLTLCRYLINFHFSFSLLPVGVHRFVVQILRSILVEYILFLHCY